MNEDPIPELIARHFDGDLSPDEEQALARALAGSPQAARALRAGARLEGGLAYLAQAGLLAASTGRQGPPARPTRRRLPRRSRAWLTLAAAAAVVLALGAALWPRPSPAAPPLRVVAAGAGDAVVRDGRTAPLRVGDGLDAGDTLRCGSGLAIAWRDESSRVDLATGGEIRLDRLEGGRRITLIAGALAADIAPQPPGQGLVFATADAEAEVVGTRLRFAIAAGGVRLDVDHGLVRLRAAGQSLDVAAGGAAIAGVQAPRRLTADEPIRVADVAALVAAIAAARPDQRIVLAPGDYRLTGVLRIGVDRLQLRGEAGDPEAVRLIGDGGDGHALIDIGDADEVTIADLTLASTREHLLFLDGPRGCRRPRLENLRLRDADRNFVRAMNGCDGGVATDCVFSSRDALTDDGFVAYLDLNGVRGWRVVGCRFGPMGLTRRPNGSVPSAILARDGAADTVCERNCFSDCWRAITFGVGEIPGHDHRGGVIRANLVTRGAGTPGDAGIAVADSPGTVIAHNTVLLSGSYPDAIEYRFAGARAVVLVNNLVDAAITARDGATARVEGNLVAGPTWFGDDAGHLSGGAAAIDAGVPMSDPGQDLDGEARPRGPGLDVGADEAR